MMKYLKIQNKGELDSRLIYLLGGTTKDEDELKIGQFGTGLKYVLAYMIRNKLDFKVFIGKKEIKITSQKEIIREKEFEIIYIDGEKTSVTAHMGMTWEPWMIIREIYSNALDEGDAKYEITTEIVGEDNTTSFYIPLTIQFLEVYNRWNKYFVVDQEPFYSNSKFDLYAGDSTFRLYKQGILIKEDKDKPSVFNYDIKNASINELREYTGWLGRDITNSLYEIDDTKVIEYFLETVDNKTYEGDLDLKYYSSRSLNNAWKETIGKARVIHKEARDRLLGANPQANLDDTILVPKGIYKALIKDFEGIGALRVINKVEEFYEIIDKKLELKVKSALVILEEIGYFIHPELTWKFGEFGDKKTLAKIDMDAKEILISQKMKDKSMFGMITMLIEENEHFQTGFSDNTREFQQHFIDLYAKTMLDKAEIKI